VSAPGARAGNHVDGKVASREIHSVKTTIDIPEALYKKAKMRAVERGQTLKQVVLGALEHELEPSARVEEAPTSAWARRKLRPEFQALWESGALSGGTDSTAIISEERDAR
jgi:uncharacterized protein YggE